VFVGVGREPADVAAASPAADEGARDHHPRTRCPAGVDRVAERDVDERPVAADVAHAREAGLQCGACVAHPGHRLLCAGPREQLGVALPAVDLAHEVRMAVDQAGQERRARQLEHGGVVGRLWRCHDRGDPVSLDHDGAVGEQVAGDDVQQPFRADDEGAGHACGLWCPGSGTRVVPQAASGAPSQQLAFMWQWGHSQRVEMGSNSTPQ
jgi:hypothetical protein